MKAEQRSVRKNRKHQPERTRASRHRPQIRERPRRAECRGDLAVQVGLRENSQSNGNCLLPFPDVPVVARIRWRAGRVR
jgi:hypothetical protein